jgi:hypothetical protein
LQEVLEDIHDFTDVIGVILPYLDSKISSHGSFVQKLVYFYARSDSDFLLFWIAVTHQLVRGIRYCSGGST